MQNNNKKEIELTLCVYMQQKSMERWRVSIHRVIVKQQVKNEQIKRKFFFCFLCFVNVFKFQEKKVEDCSKEFLGNKNNTNSKKISWKSYQSQ